MRTAPGGRRIDMYTDISDVLADHLPNGEAEDMSKFTTSTEFDRMISKLLDVVSNHLETVTE